MRPRKKRVAWLVAIGILGSTFSAHAADGPDESAMFGEPEGGKETAKGTDKPAVERDAFASGEVTDNPLSVGGRYYQRMVLSPQRGGGAKSAPISLPFQFDAFMDARPSERIRGFIDGRLLYDASRDSSGRSTSGSAGGLAFSTTSAAPTSLAGTTAATSGNPQAVLDQAWLKFDIDRTVFITAGKQHVKWGASRFWNPTDFLHTQRRDPLLPFDLRLGNTMVKLELPIESKRTNLYAVMLLDNPQPASSLGQLGLALRAETVLWSAEMGIEAIYRGGVAPTYGADLSSPLGPFDIYAEAAYFSQPILPLYAINPASFVSGADLGKIVTQGAQSSPSIQASVGANYQFGWRDSRLATVGVEYFYNQQGYSDPTAYPALIFFGQYQPFYTGRQYAAIYLTAEGPDAGKKTNYTFSTLANLADKSAISRLDFSWRALTYLTFEAYGDVHYGTRGGEFNFELSTPALTYGTVALAPVSVPATIYDLGVGLRLSF